jgi:rod shape-determining protein MreC
VRPATWISAALVTAVVLLALSPLGLASDAEEQAGNLVAPATMALRDVSRPVTDVLLHAGQLRELTAENADLRQDLARVEAELAVLREQRTATERTEALLAAVGGEASQFTSASVILRDPAPGRQVLLIDAGSADGVRAGQPVLGPGSTLVGVVAEVGEHRSRVRLLTDRLSSVSAIVQASRTPGSLDGTGAGLELNFVAADARVATGDVVLTGALGGLLPPGLVIGRVTQIEQRAQDLFPAVIVEPLAAFDRLEQVLVMTAFEPGTALALEETEAP